ncbi:MAG TPA: hypothetical protein VGW38_07275, partial [Chloroflexota bacterium]|nr:hypothetical protein [Chloroflexota bacterium]
VRCSVWLSGSLGQCTPPYAFEGHVVRLVRHLQREIVREAFERVVVECKEEVLANVVVLSSSSY